LRAKNRPGFLNSMLNSQPLFEGHVRGLASAIELQAYFEEAVSEIGVPDREVRVAFIVAEDVDTPLRHSVYKETLRELPLHHLSLIDRQ
jgi:hypothetical protein